MSIIHRSVFSNLELEADRFESLFWSKVGIQKDTTVCWLWKNKPTSWGYGNFTIKIDGKWKSFGAHKVAYELFNKTKVPKGLVVRHKCDNPLCCNPYHLEIGTQGQNMQDKKLRNRQAKGTTHGNSVATDEQVLIFRKLHQEGWTVVAISRHMNIGYDAVWYAVNVGWNHLN